MSVLCSNFLVRVLCQFDERCSIIMQIPKFTMDVVMTKRMIQTYHAKTYTMDIVMTIRMIETYHSMTFTMKMAVTIRMALMATQASIVWIIPPNSLFAFDHGCTTTVYFPFSPPNIRMIVSMHSPRLAWVKFYIVVSLWNLVCCSERESLCVCHECV